jgi:hypothetical protein
MPSSVMLRRVALVRTDVSEELSASIIRVARIGSFPCIPWSAHVIQGYDLELGIASQLLLSYTPTSYSSQAS